MSFGRLYLRKQKYIGWFKSDYFVGRLTMRHSANNSIANTWKNIGAKKGKDYWVLKPYILEINVPTSIKSISNPVLMYSNVFCYCYHL